MASLGLRYLHDSPPTPTDWLIGGIIHAESCVFVGAEEKTGKSWLVFDLAVALVTGQAVLGRWQPKKTGPVLLYSPESGWNAKKQRVWGLCRGRGLDPRRVLAAMPFIEGRLDLATDEGAKELAATCEAVQPLLLVIDPFICCARGIDENASGEVQPVLDRIRDVIASAPGMSVVVCHHLAKGHEGRSRFHGLRGSSALGAWTDTLIALERTDNRDPTSNRRMWVSHRDALSPSPVEWRLQAKPQEQWFRLEVIQ